MNRQLITPRDNKLAEIRHRSLQEAVVAIRATRGTQSAEYKALERHYGAERLEQIWREHMSREAGKGGA